MSNTRARPFSTAFLISLIPLAILALASCNLPRRGTPTPSDIELLNTAAVQTIVAEQTRTSGVVPTAAGRTPVGVQPTASMTATSSPTATFFPTATFPPLPSATFTPVPPTPRPPTATPLPCDQAKFVKDVTVPDNTVFSPGTPFTKTWRLRNSGSCIWSLGYAIVFAGGDRMGAPDSNVLPKPVAPGETVDVSVNLIAPNASGTYRGNWKLRNNANQVFGLGSENKPFWVQIKVVPPAGATFDFLVQASSATWTSGINDNPGEPLPYNGPDTDPKGAAKIKDDMLIEDGQVSGKVLLTYPRHEDNGYVSGLFPPYLVQPGDHLKARLALLSMVDGSCGIGSVIYQVSYKEGGSINPLREWTKNCDGKQMAIDVDLANLAGKTVQFLLTVRANGTWVDDWAIWNSPRVERN